nr:hypothetical protein [uncultured bacterium]
MPIVGGRVGVLAAAVFLLGAAPPDGASVAAKRGPVLPASARTPAKADDASEAKEVKAPSPGRAKSEERKANDTASARKLSPAMTTLRDRIRQVEAQYFRQPVNTGDNTAAEVIAFCLAFGCDAEIRYGNSAGNPMSGVGCLAFGYPCSGYQVLTVGDSSAIVARVGYGLQEHPGEFLAMLAQAAVPASYEIRVGDRRGSVADLVESEKGTCQAGTDLAHRLIGLSFYLRNGETWRGRTGEEWSVERVLREELARNPANDCCDVAHHLLALSFAVQRRQRESKPMDGQYRRAEKYVRDLQEYALGLANADGSWHPGFFAARGTTRDNPGQLRSTGHLLEWLAFSLPEEKLEDPRVVRSVTYVATLLAEPYARWNVTASTPREIDSVMHAVCALRIYDRRAFKSFEPVEEPGPTGQPKTTLRGKPLKGAPR